MYNQDEYEQLFWKDQLEPCDVDYLCEKLIQQRDRMRLEINYERSEKEEISKEWKEENAKLRAEVERLDPDNQALKKARGYLA